MSETEDLAEAARECVGQCDHHHGKAAEPDLETYCFTLHERCPCSLDGLAAALSAFDAAAERRQAEREVIEAAKMLTDRKPDGAPIGTIEAAVRRLRELDQ